MKRFTVLASICCALVIGGCAKDVDTSELGECAIGSKKCTKEGAYVCADGWWGTPTPCDYGCDYEVCAERKGSCTADSTKFENDANEYCVKTVCAVGSDPVVTKSDTVSCNSDNTDLGVCLNHAEKCDAAGASVCENGAWGKATHCDNGCDGKKCALPAGVCTTDYKKFENDEVGFCIETTCTKGSEPVVLRHEGVSCNADKTGVGICINESMQCGRDTGIQEYKEAVYKCLDGTWGVFEDCSEGTKQCKNVNGLLMCYEKSEHDCEDDGYIIMSGSGVCQNNSLWYCNLEGAVEIISCSDATPICDPESESGCREYRACEEGIIAQHGEFFCLDDNRRQYCNDGEIVDVPACDEGFECSKSAPQGCAPVKTPGNCEVDGTFCQTFYGEQWRVFCINGESKIVDGDLGTINCSASGNVCVQTEHDAYCDICSETDLSNCTEDIPQHATRVCNIEGTKSTCSWQCEDGFVVGPDGYSCIGSTT